MTFSGHAVATTQKAVLEAIQARLIEQLPGILTESTCVFSLEDEPTESYRSYVMALIGVEDGHFGPEQDGGGEFTLFEYSAVTVTLYARMKLDRNGLAHAVLLDADDGLLVVKRLVLKALVGWNPQDEDGQFLCINHIQAINANKARRVRRSDDKSATHTLLFSADFHWDLT